MVAVVHVGAACCRRRDERVERTAADRSSVLQAAGVACRKPVTRSGDAALKTAATIRPVAWRIVCGRMARNLLASNVICFVLAALE